MYSLVLFFTGDQYLGKGWSPNGMDSFKFLHTVYISKLKCISNYFTIFSYKMFKGSLLHA